MDCLQLLDFDDLGLFYFLVLKQLFSFFENIFAHLHGLFKVLIAVLKDLLKCLLIKFDHALLIIKHLARLIALLLNPLVLVAGGVLGQRTL